MRNHKAAQCSRELTHSRPGNFRNIQRARRANPLAACSYHASTNRPGPRARAAGHTLLAALQVLACGPL